jgi:hypothetical protein
MGMSFIKKRDRLNEDGTFLKHSKEAVSATFTGEEKSRVTHF